MFSFWEVFYFITRERYVWKRREKKDLEDVYVDRKRQNQNIWYIQDFTVQNYQRFLLCKARSVWKLSHENLMRDNSVGRRNRKVFFIKEVCFFKKGHYGNTANWLMNSSSDLVFCKIENICFFAALKFELILP